MDQHYGGKAGNSPAAEAEVGPIAWADAEAPGVGNLRWRNWDWVMLDYRDRLTLPDDMQSVLRKGQAAVDDSAIELRECAILNVAAAVLQHQLGRRPSSSEAQELALDFRRALLHEAIAAEGAAGDLPAVMTQAECDVRTYIHDLVYRDQKNLMKLINKLQNLIYSK